MRVEHSNLLNIAKCMGRTQHGCAQMLFLPECLGFMGDSSEHTQSYVDLPIDVLLDVPALMATPFWRELSIVIASYEATPGNNLDEDDCGDKETSTTTHSIIEELQFIARESNLWISGGGVH